MKKQNVKIYSVIISYCPDQSQLLKLCENLAGDGSCIVIVDNTEMPYLDGTLFPAQCQILHLGFNAGIAHAQNLGVQMAISEDADVIVFFDQDSTPRAGFLGALIAPLRVGTPDVVAPLCIDEVSSMEVPSIRIKKNGIPIPILRESHMRPYEVDIIISSGTAMTHAFDAFLKAKIIKKAVKISNFFSPTHLCT